MDKSLFTEILDGMDDKIKSLETQVENMKDDVIKEKRSRLFTEGSNSEPKIKLSYKEWAQSGIREMSEFAKQKGLALDGNAALYEAELNTTILEQAIANTAVLNAIGNRATENLDYRRTVLTQRPETKLTAENINFVPVEDTEATDYATISGQFTKMYAMPFLTHEAIEQSDVAVQSNVQKLVAEEFSLTMQEQILFGDGTLDGGTRVQQLRGICNAAINRSGNYADALQPAATRNRDLFAAVASGIADGIGGDSSTLEANLYKLMLTVPERSQGNAQFVMHPNTLSFIMQTLKDTQGRSLIDIEIVKENSVWVRRIRLFGANVILNDTMDEVGSGNAPIIFGDLAAGYEMLIPAMGSHSIVDPYTVKGSVGFYSDAYFGSTVVDHEAIAVLVCQA